MIFFDTHCHFDFPEFDCQRDGIWSNAQSLGIAALLIPSVSPNTWHQAKRISETASGVVWAAGLHPWWIKEFLKHHTLDDLIGRLNSAIEDKHCVAIGETGLDKLIDLDLSTQISCLQCHIDCAKNSAKPLILHSRKTHAELMAVIKKNQPLSGGVIHAFSGSYQQAKAFIDAGFYLGVGGVITYERAKKTREAIQKIPLEYLVLETDAPDMPLQGQQSRTNTPINLIAIADSLAKIKQLSLEKVAEQTTANANRLFGVPDVLR